MDSLDVEMLCVRGCEMLRQHRTSLEDKLTTIAQRRCTTNQLSNYTRKPYKATVRLTDLTALAWAVDHCQEPTLLCNTRQIQIYTTLVLKFCALMSASTH